MKKILLSLAMLLFGLTAFTQSYRPQNVPVDFRCAVKYTGVLTPDTLDASANNYDPGGLTGSPDTATVIRLQASTAVNLTGLKGGVDGRVVFLYNIGANNITIKDESGSSTAANRFALAADIVLATDESLMFIYDGTASRWRSFSKSTSSDFSAATAVVASWAWQGDISPTSISTSQNNYAPTGLSGATVLRLTSSANVNITGLTGGADGRFLTIYNIGTFNITLKNESGSSTAANRFTSSGDVVLRGGECVNLSYDATSSRWRIISRRIEGEQIIGKLTGANLNITTDQTIPIMNASKFVITKIIVTNASVDISGGSTAGGVYPTTSKGGTAIVANSQTYTALSAATKYVALTLASVTTTDVYTVSNIYFSLTTGFGSACTADIYVYGYILEQ